MSLEYAPDGLIGVMTPQANTTVEPEMALLFPPRMAMISARLTSPSAVMRERLVDYVKGLDDTLYQFGIAPLSAIAFACTGSSYFVGTEAEDRAVARLSQRVPFVTTAHAVCDALRLLGARRVGLVSPYPPDVTEASAAYWTARGFEVGRIVMAEAPPNAHHAIYAMGGDAAEAALKKMAGAGVDAIVLLGTGMPSLGPILAHPQVDGAPVISCLLALAWRSVAAAKGEAPDGAVLRRWIAGEGWGARYRARLAG